MKQETKELIEWIKLRIHDDKNPKANGIEYANAIDFLDSLPEIESKLCQGGYIQDKNGKPCCNGDKVRFEFEEDG